MKALHVSLLLLTILAVACAPQRRAPTVRATKPGPGIGLNKNNDKTVLDKDANKVLQDQGFQLDLGKAVSKVDSSIKKKDAAVKVEASTAVAKPADKAKDTAGFVIDISGLKENVRTVVVDQPEIKVASTKENESNGAIKTNAAAAVFACLDAELIKPSECKDVEVRISLKDENDKDVEIVSNRKLSKSVVVTDVNGQIFGKANVEDITTSIGENGARQININIVSAKTNAEQKVDIENVIDTDGLKVKVAISGLSKELQFEHELLNINVSQASDSIIKILVGLKDNTLGVDSKEEGDKIVLLIDLNKTFVEETANKPANEQPAQEGSGSVQSGSSTTAAPLEVRKLGKIEVTAKREKPAVAPSAQRQGQQPQLSDIAAP